MHGSSGESSPPSPGVTVLDPKAKESPAPKKSPVWCCTRRRISTIVSKNSPLVFADLRIPDVRIPPLFSAKIIYENTLFAKKIRACGAKMNDLAKILETRGNSYIRGNS